MTIFYVADRHGLDHDRRFELRAQGWMSHGGCGYPMLERVSSRHTILCIM